MRKWKQRLFSLLLCGAMLASLCTTALAENVTGQYWVWNEGTKQLELRDIPTDAIEITNDYFPQNDPKLDAGTYCVTGDHVSSNGRIEITGEVHLILVNGCALNAENGIEVSEGNSLTIYAQSKDENDMGKLAAYSRGGAAIGGGNEGSGGNITINGGSVTAASGAEGAGIGGGNSGEGGTITISGGEVTATSRDGAGIGGGKGGAGGTITINKGKVTAASTDDVNFYGGAGIGGGGDGGGGGSITISGGMVEASSGSGADIGGGESRSGDIAPSDKIEISEGANVKGSGGGKPNLGPPHGAKTEWASDSTDHWHPCEVESCAEQFDKDAHSYGNKWKSDADRHWHECSCGDKSDEAAHSFSDWTIDTPATATTAGSKHRECGICQYRETETIPATGGGGGGGYVPPTYRPDVTQPSQGGSVSVSPSSPQRGDTVTVTPRPDEGYELDSITVTDRDGKGVELTAGPDGTYTFQQPSGRVKIEVAFKPIETPWNNPFSDVSQDDWYYEAVRFAQEQGLMNGYSDGRFGAEDTLSRSQLAQILFNKEGRPGVNYLPEFSDMAGGAWYTEAVRWAASQGIVGGYGDGTFGPNAPITREQLAVMLWRYSGSPAAASTELDFNDEGQISGYALEALRWAVESGVLNGDGGGRLDPQGQATRAQVAQILKNFLEEENT